jgi:hypothetical protein
VNLGFSLHGFTGAIAIKVRATRRPGELGAAPGAAGLAFCEATVRYPGKGYTGMLGWIQLVRSTDNSSGGRQFEMDPLEILGDVPHPFGFFGIKPTLFDAPSRDSRADLDWLAHSFLCHVADPAVREIHAVAGFAWGFTIAEGVPACTSPRALEPAEWNQHLGLLRAAHPAWRFAQGFRET